MGKKKGKGISSKAKEKEQLKKLKELTFGLKNKKSKKVQNQIKMMESQIKGNLKSQGMSEKEKRKMKKLEEKERERELKKIFGETKKRDEFRHEDEEKTAEEFMEQIDNDLDEEEEMTLEDIIEKERSKILQGTPVTLETFAKWKEFKDSQKKKSLEKEKKLRIQSGGLSGKELYEMNVKIFVDDKEASQKQDYAIDEDLFMDSSDEEDEEDEGGDSYDPSTWKEEKKPKTLLQEFHSQTHKLPQNQWPKYEERKPEGKVVGRVYFAKCILPAYNNKEFICEDMFSKKKDAENAVAYIAYKWVQEQGAPKE